MIAGIFYNGSGLGNQLHRYVATRVLALDKGYDWGMIYKDDGSGKEPNFKGQSFMDIDWGKEATPETMSYYDSLTNIQYPLEFYEKKVVENGVDIRGYDPEFNFISDGTVIDGEFQDERYWQHKEKEVDEWLKVEPLDIPDDVCVIGFRGGEFAVFSDLFLGYDYWSDAIQIMKDKGITKFEVHADDIERARLLPIPEGTKIIHDIGINWRSMRYAKYAIIANSSFYILPRWLRNGITIAPRYWARRNTGVWALPQNYYSRWTYL